MLFIARNAGDVQKKLRKLFLGAQLSVSGDGGNAMWGMGGNHRWTQKRTSGEWRSEEYNSRPRFFQNPVGDEVTRLKSLGNPRLLASSPTVVKSPRPYSHSHDHGPDSPRHNPIPAWRCGAGVFACQFARRPAGRVTRAASRCPNSQPEWTAPRGSRQAAPISKSRIAARNRQSTGARTAESARSKELWFARTRRSALRCVGSGEAASSQRDGTANLRSSNPSLPARS